MTLRSVNRFGRAGKRAFFWRFAAVNLAASYLPGLAFLLIADVVSWTIAWVFVGVAPVVFPAVLVGSRLDYGTSPFPLLGGGILLSVFLIATVTYYGVHLKEREKTVRHLPLALLVSSAIQTFIGIVLILRANA